MSEDGERSTPSWWKSRWYHDPEIEGEVIRAIRAKDRPSTGAVYRVFLFVCGILFFFAGWITWNIGLPVEGESGAVGMNLKTFLFFIGLFFQFIIGPYFALISISNSGRLSPLMPKALAEYYRLKSAISDREVYDHYWEALRDPGHEHHNEIIRYKWMDKVRWKHHPRISLDIRFLRKSLVRKPEALLFQRALPSTVIRIPLMMKVENVCSTRG